MVDLAKVTGDIRENSLVPDKVLFRHSAFWTSHFGGVYIFVDDNTTTVIGDPSVAGLPAFPAMAGQLYFDQGCRTGLPVSPHHIAD